MNNYQTTIPEENALEKIAIATLFGATIGAVIGILSLKNTSQNIDRSIRKAGEKIEDTVSNLNQIIRNTSNTIEVTTNSINETVRQVGNSVKDSAVNANETIQDTLNSVKTTAMTVNDTVKNTTQIVQGTVNGVEENIRDTANIAQRVTRNQGTGNQVRENQDVKINNPNSQTTDNQTTYILVPVDDTNLP